MWSRVGDNVVVIQDVERHFKDISKTFLRHFFKDNVVCQIGFDIKQRETLTAAESQLPFSRYEFLPLRSLRPLATELGCFSGAFITSETRRKLRRAANARSEPSPALLRVD